MTSEERLYQSKIMIVDDQEALCGLLKNMLEEERFSHVLALSDPKRAVSLYQEFNPDLLILDINMPGMDGFQIMERLKDVEKNSYLPVLVVTGEAEMEVRYRALRSGAKDFLSKPFNPIETIARIKNLLEVRLLHNEVRNQNQLLQLKIQEKTSELREALLNLGIAHKNVRTAYIETIYHLTRASEFKDGDTSAHIKRISQYSGTIADALGLNQDQTDLLYHASPMHDIGKIGIPDRILLKPGPLDAPDWEIMKTHTTIGAQILHGSDAPILKTGEVIALSHHEHWDGSGYPRGLRGENIPLEGRIVMMVDVYDALRSKRTYKPAIDHKNVCDIILYGDHKLKPIYFDPDILNAFKAISSKFEKIYDENQD